MNFRLSVPIIAAAVLAAACDEPEVYDSSVNEKASVQLTVDWGEFPEGETIPDGYTVIFADIDTLQLNTESNLIDELPTGDARIMLYNVPESCSAEGSIITLYESPDNYNIGSLYTSSADIRITPNIVNEIGVNMIQRTKQIKFSVNENIQSVAVKFEAASKIDVEYNRVFEPKNINLELTKGDNGIFNGEVDYIGFTENSLRLSFEFTMVEDNVERWVFDLTPDKIGNLSKLPAALNIAVEKADSGYEAIVDGVSEKFSMIFVPTAYKVGDYYPDPINVNGVVYSVAEDGRSGKVVSLTNGHYHFRSTNGSAGDNAGVVNTDDGMANMNTVKAKDVAFVNYPAYAWCVTLGEGWYLPAQNELNDFYAIWSENKAIFNGKFEVLGGDEIVESIGGKEVLYFSSTENGSQKLYWKGWKGKNTGNSPYKTPGESGKPHYLFRAIKTFEITEE